MRISGGLYKGRVIVCPPGVIRPAMERMRESLFSILGDISDEPFLDLFSGSGLVGIEAASRGASPVHLVESDWKKHPIIRGNISFVEQQIRLFPSDVFKFLPNVKQQYEIVYADPPFNLKEKDRIGLLISKHNVLKPSGLYIIHYPSEEKEVLSLTIGTLKAFDERKYGRSILRFYKES
ncbi:MAG: 16S rRNA (guanine(966)-N(2))-methyltransferase RsmD [Candidatus Cloacimonetes bacterium]|jgi:16S rRNA (guanine(966)-N(2))-methyltransferase RsmD|nr:16S rRNA (guanine(966)-N(2))-methyltransferase RsmD [Candidatus Cloacimonadota bacterium]